MAVVVPSPATSFVLDATDLTSWAPMFSKLSSKSMDLATVTPSLVILGGPYGWAMMALRPLGPSVTYVYDEVLREWRCESVCCQVHFG